MLTCSDISTPMCPSNKLHNGDSTQFLDESPYRSIVGGLQYLTFTRTDISLSVNEFCQFMHSPTEKHRISVKRILRYLKSTSSHVILFSKQNSQQLQGYCGADWGCSIDDRKSTTGYAIFLGSSLVSWCSLKQRSVSHSTTEAEYRSLAAATSELLWVRLLLKEIDLSSGSLPSLWCDNLSATYLTANPVLHSRTKHMKIDFHFIRDLVQKKELWVQYISSHDKLADILTKPLLKDLFYDLHGKLNFLPGST